jgi:hypothetical protein
MEFYDVVDQVLTLLQRRGRVTYNALKLQFHLDDDQLAVLKDESLYAYPQVVDDAGRGLRWTGDTATAQVPELGCPAGFGERAGRTYWSCLSGGGVSGQGPD